MPWVICSERNADEEGLTFLHRSSAAPGGHRLTSHFLEIAGSPACLQHDLVRRFGVGSIWKTKHFVQKATSLGRFDPYVTEM
jgi:hypothetical protein